MKTATIFTRTLIIAALLSFCACGGGGSSSPSTGGGSSTPTTAVNGIVFASPVSGATVSAKDAGGRVIAGPVTSAADGTYSINIPTSALTSDLRIESMGGTFVDEATGAAASAGALAAFIPSGSLTAGSPVTLDPSSTIVCDLATRYAKTITDAQAIFAAAYGYMPDTSIVPKNSATTVTDGSDVPNRLAAVRAGAFSRLTKDLGLAPDRQFELLTALAADLADDGKLNGSTGSVNGTNLAEDIQNKYDQALRNFQADNTHDLTGLTAADIAAPCFGKVVLTNNYRVEYVPGMMAATQGKTAFKVKIRKRSDNSAATGLAVSLMPIMHMATMSHGSPADAVTEDGANAGTYNCTVYYLMASGSGMGYWELKVAIGGMAGETATFYPPVGMSMGTTTVRATLKGLQDTVAGTPPAGRTYYLFNSGLASSNSAATFNLFIAANESMMSYPAVSAGATLHDAANAPWIVNPMVVLASTDKTTWVAAVDNGNGHWSAPGLAGLTIGQTGTIYVKVTVNGEQKTTNGSAVSDTNGYASFTVTP